MASLAAFILAAALCAHGKKLNRDEGFLARHSPLDGTLEMAEDKTVATAQHDEDFEVEVLNLVVGKPDTDDARSTTTPNGPVDASAIKIKTEMVMPTYVKAEKYPTPIPQKIGGSCVCPLGEFLDSKTKKCTKQIAWGVDCGSFPKRVQHRVCKDGLVCKRWSLPDNFKAVSSSTGGAGKAPFTCEKCEADDDCKTGKERHENDCLREGDVADLVVSPDHEEWENNDMFEAWGGKASGIKDAKILENGEKIPLTPFGRAEPKMCVTAQVTVPRLTIEKKTTRVIESKVTVPLKVVVNASEGANATATATAEVKRRALVRAQASASASSKASAAARASYTAYESATETEKATHEAVVSAQASRKVAGTGNKAKIMTEATGASSATREATASTIGKATRTGEALETAAADVTVTQTGTGDAEAVAKKEVTVNVLNWTESATRSKVVNSTGVGSLTIDFKASASSKATVETKACVSAHQARKLLGDNSLGQTGVEFARIVYKKAQQEAYAQAKVKGYEMATDAATKAAEQDAAKSLEEQVKKFSKTHKEDLDKAALDDAWKNTESTQEKLRAEAKKEAITKAQKTVKQVAAAKAKLAAEKKATLEAESKATEMAKKEAQEEARAGIEAKVLAKVKDEARDAANEKAKAKALAKARGDAEKAAEATAKSSASDLADSRAQEAAKASAEKIARAEAVEAAEDMTGTGAEGVIEKVVKVSSD